MLARKALILSMALALMAACRQGHRQMTASLEELERMNSADSLMTNDSLAMAVAGYFDSHGTPNERLRAHYMLGRTYADMGEAPAAITAYKDAADCADTCSTDCDYHTLSRVYGQMAKVFYGLDLLDSYLDCLDLSAKYAWKDGDTLQALNEYAHKLMAYDRLSQHDKVISLFDDVFARLQDYCGEETAAKYCPLVFNSLLETGRLDKAGHYLRIYESKSGYFHNNNIEEGRESFYYYKGAFFLYTHNYDSAEYFFRKELRLGRDFLNQNMGSYGLAKLFLQTERFDSAAKYSIYGYEMNDSTYNWKATEELNRTKSLYDYSRFQRLALKEKDKAKAEHQKRQQLYIVLAFLLAVIFSGILFWRKNRKKEELLYNEKIAEIEKIKRDLTTLKEKKLLHERKVEVCESTITNQLSEINSLKRHEDEYKSLIKEKERQIAIKNNETRGLMAKCEELTNEIREKENALADLRKSVAAQHPRKHRAPDDKEYSLLDHPLYKQLFCNKANLHKLTKGEWAKVEDMMKNELPAFHEFVTMQKPKLTSDEYHICILLRLHLGLKEVSLYMGDAQTKISKSCSRILNIVFGAKGSGKELKRILLNPNLEA